jgi:hypothetical protein
MNMRLDWKFWVVLATTLAGVLVPVWLWRADLAARSLHFTKVSQTSLQPPANAKALDLTISVEGAELSTPYLTVFELANDGAKPVPSSDFESAIEIVSKNKAQIVRTSVTSSNPPDLKPLVTVEAGAMKIQPMLFNPGDSVTIAVLTTGEEPSFTSRARIAGVQSVPIIEAQNKSGSPVRIVVVLLVAMICLVAGNLVVGGWPSRGIHLRPRSAFVVFMVANIAGAFLMIIGLEALGVEGFLPLVVVYIVSMLLTSFISDWLNRSKSAPGELTKGVV